MNNDNRNFPLKRVEGDKKTEIRIPSIDYARILKIRAIEQRMLDMICFCSKFDAKIMLF